MGSSQVKSAEETPLKLDSKNLDTHFLSADRVTIGFGMLHILKAIINKTRNFSLCFRGQNYGIHILRSMKNGDDIAAEYLSKMKNAVLVGKDRQSDYLSYMTTSDTVQCALKEKGHYLLTRVPEPVLTYKDNAKKQKPFVFPVAVVCNKIGDVFVLDAGAACLFGFDRFSVAKSYIVGSHMSPSLQNYDTNAGPLKGKDIKFSNRIPSMDFVEDDLYVVDSDRRELVIIKRCNLAKNIRKSIFYVCKDSKYSCIARSCNGSLIALEYEECQVVHIIKISTPSKCSLYLSKEILRQIIPSYKINSVFPLVSNMGDCSFGAVRTDDQKIVFFLEFDEFSGQVSNQTSTISPYLTSDTGLLLTSPVDQDRIAKSVIDIDTDNSVSCSFVGYLNDNHATPLAVTCWGSTLMIVGKEKNQFKLQECGLLDFGIRLTAALNLAYHAAAYLPPHGIKDIKERTLPECIEETQVLADLLNEMQKEKEEIFPTRKCFSGAEGNAYSKTVACFNNTIAGWKTIINRFKKLDRIDLVDKIRPRAVVNESIIEHSFGFVTLKAGKQLQDMFEYVHNKAKHELDFQMRLTELPFCQHTKVKLRDKSYQDLDSSLFSKMDMDDFWDIFCDDPKTEKKKPIDVHPADSLIKQQAYLLTKSVPRRSNRSKWKEQSGHAPSLLSCPEEDSYLLTGDMVFSRVLNKNLALLIKKKVALTDENCVVDVMVINDASLTEKLTIKVQDLFHQHGQIFVVPSTLFELADCFEDVVFNEIIAEDVNNVLSSMGSTNVTMSDEEWSIIPDVNYVEDVDFTVSKSKDTENQETQIKRARTDDVGLVPTHGSFYIVKLVRESDGFGKFFVVQNNASNNIGGLYWMNFMHRIDPTSCEFSWMNSDGLVSSHEILMALTEPVGTSQSSTRRGNLRFTPEELNQFVLQ